MPNRAPLHLRAILVGLLPAMIMLASAACDRDRHAEEEKHLYRRLRSETCDLYIALHPLQASRAGCRRADSLLYLYSREELEEAPSRIKRLDDGLRHLAVSYLEEREIEDSRMLIMWLKGERFGLEELQYHRYNPLLYCWIVEEALWGIPSRPEPPYEGEFSAYEKRILQIPELLRNASELIENPPKPYVKLASQHTRRVLESIPALKATLEERYARRVTLSEAVTRSLTGFLGFLEGTLSSQTRGYTILGSENISKIFLYDEGIEIDPAGLITEAEARIRRITTEKANALRAAGRTEGAPRRLVERGGSALVEHILETVEKRDEREGGADSRTEAPIEVRSVRDVRLPCDAPKSANLTLPSLENGGTSLLCIRTPSGAPCTQILFVDENRSGIGFLYDVLAALSEREPRIIRCLRADTVRTLLGSNLYRYAIRSMEIENLIGAFPLEKKLLDKILAEEEIRALAMTVVVLELHAGTFTTDSAVEYLMRKTHLSREEAVAGVGKAYYSPSIAYPGIALLTVDRIVKKAASTRGTEPAEERVRRLLVEKYYLPLQLIGEGIPGE